MISSPNPASTVGGSTSGSTGTTAFGIDWSKLGADVAAIAAAVAPFVPSASAAVLLGSKIIQGVMDEIPAAVALYNQISSGAPPTAAELAQYQSDYEVAYQKLNSDIADQLAKLPS